ncbi:MAG: NAD(P)-binding domain-containing protein [Methanosarcinaceae archaeon]|nr:NAD(P)-binding domain-containing protein [Methanosarcinaceae archaeon]
MKIAILGGTGSIGKGFALRLNKKHEIIIGSRDAGKAKATASEYNDILTNRGIKAEIKGTDNKTAAENADVILIAVKYNHIGSVSELIRPVLNNQIVVSVVVPIEKDYCYIHPDTTSLKIPVSREDYNANYFCYVTPPAGSAAQELAALLPANIELVSAFHNVPAKKLADLDVELDYDIGVSGNSMHGKKVVFDLVRDISNLRPLDVGPLETSAMIESLTPLIINISAKNKLKNLGIKFL